MNRSTYYLIISLLFYNDVKENQENTNLKLLFQVAADDLSKYNQSLIVFKILEFFFFNLISLISYSGENYCYLLAFLI